MFFVLLWLNIPHYTPLFSLPPYTGIFQSKAANDSTDLADIVCDDIDDAIDCILEYSEREGEREGEEERLCQ